MTLHWQVGGALGLTLMAARPRNQRWLDTPTGPLAVQIHGGVGAGCGVVTGNIIVITAALYPAWDMGPAQCRRNSEVSWVARHHAAAPPAGGRRPVNMGCAVCILQFLAVLNVAPTQ